MSDLSLLPIRCEDDRVAVVERAAAALAQIATPTDAKAVADLAAAAEKYGKLKRADKEALSRTVALKVDAMARMGELLAAMDLNAGGRPTETGSQMEPVLTLHEMGISKKESMYAQALAIVKEINPDLYRSIRESGRIKDAHEWMRQQEERSVDKDEPDKAELQADWFDQGDEQFRAAIGHLRKARELFDELLRARAGKFLAEVEIAPDERLFTLQLHDTANHHGRKIKKVWLANPLEILLAAAERVRPARICAGCQGKPKGCSACMGSGFVPADERILETYSQRELNFGDPGAPWEGER